MEKSKRNYWFKLENGTDLLPATWQGWVVVAAFVGIVGYAIYLFMASTRIELTLWPVLRLALTALAATFTLYQVGRIMGEPVEID